MASPTRSHSFWGNANLQQPAIAVVPLNCVPYTGPLPEHSDYDSLPSEVIDLSYPLRDEPTLVFLPHDSTEKELTNILAATKHGVAVSGSAARGKVGPTLGSIDIAESSDTYLFRVSLPGVARDGKEFQCDFEPNGRILINGVTTTGETKVYKNNMVFEMQTQNLCPAGDFSISFQLPGPIDPHEVSAILGTDGVFEGVVRKKSLQSF